MMTSHVRVWWGNNNNNNNNNDIKRQSLAGKHQSSILTKLGWHHSRLLHTKTNLFGNQTKKIKNTRLVHIKTNLFENQTKIMDA